MRLRMAIRRARSRLRGVAGSIGPALWLLAGIGVHQPGRHLRHAGPSCRSTPRIDITAGMLVGVVAPLVTVAAMLAFRSRPLPSPV